MVRRPRVAGGIRRPCLPAQAASDHARSAAHAHTLSHRRDYMESAEVTGPGMFNLMFTRCSPADATVRGGWWCVEGASCACADLLCVRCLMRPPPPR